MIPSFVKVILFFMKSLHGDLALFLSRRFVLAVIGNQLVSKKLTNIISDSQHLALTGYRSAGVDRSK